MPNDTARAAVVGEGANLALTQHGRIVELGLKKAYA
jgi:NAD-specific glutamate dehydrogenase